MYLLKKYVKCHDEQKYLITRNIHVKYQRSFKLALTVSTLLKSWCFKTQVELKGQGYMVKMLIPTEESCHNEYTCVNVWDNLDLNVRQKSYPQME